MASNVTSSSAIDRSILVTYIPYVTDDSGKLKDALEKYFGEKKIGGGDVQRVMCPLGGTMTTALIVFEYQRVMDTIFNYTHQLGEEEIQVARLPPVFTKVKGTLDDFYFSILPRSRFRELVKQLGKILGADHLQATKSKVTELTGTTDDLKAAAECLLEAFGMTGVQEHGPHTAYITERCLDIDNIPYMTDDVAQMKDELGVYFKQNGGEVQSVICPIMGKSTRAIVIFKSVQDRNRVLNSVQHAELSFYDNTLDVQHLPKVFTEVIAEVDTFYVKSVPKLRMKKLCVSMSEQFGPSFTTKDGKILSGSLEQICDAGVLIMRAIGVADEDKPGLAMTEDPGLKQVSSEKHRTTSGVSEEEGAKQNLHQHIRDEPLQDVSATVSAQTDESKQSKSTQYHHGTGRTWPSSGRFAEAGSQPNPYKHMRDESLQDFTAATITQVDVSRETPQNHPGTARRHASDGRSDQSGSEPNPNKHVRDDPFQDISATASKQADVSKQSTLITHSSKVRPRASGDRFDEARSEPSTHPHIRDNDFQEERATASIQPDGSRNHPGTAKIRPSSAQVDDVSRRSTYKDSGTARPVDDTQDNYPSPGIDSNGTNRIRSAEGHVGNPRCAANFSNDPKSIREPFTEQTEVPDNHQGIDDKTLSDEASSNRDSSVSGAPILEAAFKDCFLTVDKMRYQYWKRNLKTEFQKIETTYDVKIKLSSRDSKDENELLVELQAKSSKGAKTKQKKDNVLMAQEEFVRLYSDIHSATHKASVPFNATEDKKLHKIQDRITKSFPSVIVAWNETECILCGENATVEKAVQVMKDVISEYETFSVDKIAYRYLSTVNKGKLDNIKKRFHVTIELQQDKDTAQNETQQAVHVKPSKNKKKYSAEDLRKAKDEFISLYQDTFFSIKRMPVKCLGISKKAVNDAAEQTKKTYPDVFIITEDSPNEVIICAEEKDLDGVVRAFRNSAGLVSKRRLKKSNSNDMEQPDLSYQDKVQSTSSDRHHQIQSSAGVESSLPSSVFVTPEGLQIIVVTGDITKQDVDVIVNAANTYMDLNGGVAKAISTAAGPQLQKECKDILRRKHLAMAIGDCIDTNPFQLHCKRVVHAVGPIYTSGNTKNFSSDLEKTFSTILLKSDVLCARSISIPLISSGNSGGPKQTCAEVLVKALQDFSRNAKDRHLQQVNLVNIDEKVTSILQRVCGGIFLPKHHPTNADTLRESTQAKGKAKSAIQGTAYKTSNGLEIFVESGDITQTRVEVIVNAANDRLRHGRGVAGAIRKAAGAELQEECNRIMKNRQPLQPEECVMTDGYKLKCRILHIVGPVYKDCYSNNDFFRYLKATFLSALRYVNLPVEAKDVAIPLVSSGIYGGPKQICAEALLDAIEEFNKEHTLVVKQIHLINLDDDATEALQEVFNRRFPKSSSTQTATESASESEPTLGIDVQVIHGDITTQNVDVIVNPTDINMRNNIGAAKAISAAAGQKLQERCRVIMRTRNYKTLVTGEVTETAGFGLRCKHILHTLSPYFNLSISEKKYHDTLRDIYLTCLRMANNFGQSIAIPLIGTGNLGAPKELCAHALMKAIETFDKATNPKLLKKVVIISIDKEAVLAAEMSITNYFPNYRKQEEVSNREPSAHASPVDAPQVYAPPVDAPPADAPPIDAPPTGRFQTDEGLLLVNSFGNITNNPSDVMISCTDERHNHKDGISTSIYEAAGPKLKGEYKECIKHRKSSLKPGEMIATSGYKLQCQKVLHVIEPKLEAMESTLLHSLLFAQGTLSAKKITLSLMGSAIEGSPIGLCAQKTANAVKRFSRTKTSVREIHFINVGFDETSALHKALSATFKPDESYKPQESTTNQQSGASNMSNADRYQGNTNGRGSLTKGLDSNDPLTVATSNTGRHNINQLDQGAVPKVSQQHQTMQDTVSSVSSTYGYMSSFFKPVVDVFYPASNSTVTTSAATQPVTSSRVGATQPPVTVSVTFIGSGVAQQSVTLHDTGSVAAQYSVIPSTGSGATQNPVTLPATTESYASVTRTTSRTSSSDVANPSKHTGCGKCWAQTNCKLLEGCGHMFCRNCIVRYIAPNSRCWTCSSLYCETREETLKGTMTYFIKDDIKISGQSESGAIVIKYQFPDGFSRVHHGRQYNGNSFEAYLPNNADGLEIVWLLRTAFVAGHTFTVASFRGGPLQVNWSSIPHKVNITGGIRDFGYPDSEYLMRVRDVLKDKHGIVSNISS